MRILSRSVLRGAGSFIAIILFFSFYGCASIIKGSAPQQVSLKTEPTDAKCALTDLGTGSVVMQQNSPILTQLKRDSGYFKNIKYRFSCEKDGFKQNQVDFESTVNGWYIGGNILFGGLIGWLIVDPATGAMWSFTSDDITLALESPASVSPSAEEKGAVSITASYFQGSWIGSWRYSMGGREQDVTITVGKKNPDGTFDTEYSWGSLQGVYSVITAGTVKVKGREDGDKFVFEFNNPNDFKINSIEMTKYESEKVKAKMAGVNINPDGYLNRK